MKLSSNQAFSVRKANWKTAKTEHLHEPIALKSKLCQLVIDIWYSALEYCTRSTAVWLRGNTMPVTQSIALCDDDNEDNGFMHAWTPLLQSPHLSSLVGRDVRLKMESTQPSGSYKIRGHGHLCACEVRSGTRKLICSSGGNAGAAVAYAARELEVESVVIVPSTTPNFMVKKLRNLGATVEVVGDVWDESDAYARKLVTAAHGSAAYVPVRCRYF